MTELDHLLVILSEECAEISQRVSKALRFGLAEVEPEHSHDNATRIGYEIADFIAVVEMLEERGVTLRVANQDSLIAAKKHKVTHFLGYSEQLGTLHGATNA